MKITILDLETIGVDLDLSVLRELGEVDVYNFSTPEEVPERIADSDVVLINKVKLGEPVLKDVRNLKLICIFATGYDNIDTNYCASRGIGVCNVAGYSTQNVAQITIAMVMQLVNRMPYFNRYVASGEYTESGMPNLLSPVYHEIYGKTWGIIGYGNIGRQVAKVAEAFGCRVIVNKNTPVEDAECVDLDTLLKESDIISLHTPLSDATRGLIGANEIAKMKDGVIFVNVARGAVTDEAAVAAAIKSGKIGGFGCDVYSVEPFSGDHPFWEIKDREEVCLTPHLAWGAYESRLRCLNEVALNIKAFLAGEKRNRV